MNEFALIKDIALIWAVALVTGVICIRLRQPVIAGYMLAGLVVGPHVLKLISQPEQITVLADFGVAMLLFALGVDLSLKQVIASARRLLSAGIVQVVLTLAGGWAIAWLTGLASSPGEGFLFGSVCAISSSVVISRTLIDRGELDSVHGRILVPLSLVQDLSLVVIIPFLPVLQASAGTDLSGVLMSGLKAALFMILIIVGATKAVPPLLARAAKSNSKEIFLLTILVLCLGIALLSHALGLSIALGAFLAGIMMSESVYAHQALHDVSPLRDVFSTIFFVSVGMLLDPVYIGHHVVQVLLFVVILIVGKAVIGTAAALLATNNLRSAILVGVGLGQIGEFSFVLLTLGYGYKLINDSMYNLFFAGAVVSMMATPALMLLVPRLMLRRFQRPDTKNAQEADARSGHSQLRNHVIICGFGRIGHNLGLVLQSFEIPFVVVELNASIIEDLAVRGIPHIYGDAMSQLVLVKARLKQAASLVLTMPDPMSAEAVAAFARERNPELKIVARAHRTEDIRIFRTAGVNAVVQPEFEASIEITRLVLHSLNRPGNEISRALEQIRTRRYAIFQPDIDNMEPGAHVGFDDGQMGIWFRVTSEQIRGKSLRELNVRSETGATIMGVKSNGKTTAFPDPTFQLELDDEMYTVGNSEQLHKFEEMFGLVKTSKAVDVESASNN